MDLKVFAIVFTTVFIAELGDKTQIATLLFASDRQASKLTIFAGAALALVLSSALGVLAGTLLSAHVSERTLQTLAGIGFIAVGIWTLIRG